VTETRSLESLERERRDRAQQLRFFDAGIWLGQPQGFPLARELPPDELHRVARGYYLTGGLVSHWAGFTVSAQEGNRALVDTVAKLPAGDPPGLDLSLVWTALPLYPRESEPVPGHGDLPASVRAVRIFPARHRFPLADWCVGSLCDWLAERRVPLLIWHTELDWPSLYSLARRFPQLPIVVESQTQKILYHTRPLFALMRDCANVQLEISNFAGAGFLEHAVLEFGAQRLIYGSFLPVADPWVPIGMLVDADIAEADKALIAGDNLRRLLSEVRA